MPEYQKGATLVNPDLKLSPFYHSAVNTVTRPNQVVWTTQYFVDRWMPLLGGNATMIVLALRRHGYLNAKTGERRDEIVITRPELAALIGTSKDTLPRELGDDPKTGKPNNPWLRHFVQPRHRSARNARGQMQQIANAYWVSMDDPVHPDDWPLVEAAAEADGWQRDKAPAPETHFAFPVEDEGNCGVKTPETDFASSVSPETHFAANSPQNAAPKTHFAAPETQNASALKNYSSLPFTTKITTDKDTQASSDSQASVVVDFDFDSLDVWEEQDEDAVIAALKLAAEEMDPVKAEPVAPEPPVVPCPVLPQVPANDPSRAVHRAASGLADCSGLGLDVLEDYISKWRDDGDTDSDIAQLLEETSSVLAAKNPKPGNPAGFVRRTLENKADARRAKARASAQAGIGAQALPELPNNLEALRSRYEAMSKDDQQEVNRRASLLVRDAVGSLEAYKALPAGEYRALMRRAKAVVLTASAPKVAKVETEEKPAPAETQGDAPVEWAYQNARQYLSAQGAAAFKAKHGRISEHDDWVAYARVLEAEAALRTEIESYSADDQHKARLAVIDNRKQKTLLPDPKITVGAMKIEALTALRDHLHALARKKKTPAKQLRVTAKEPTSEVADLPLACPQAGFSPGTLPPHRA